MIVNRRTAVFVTRIKHVLVARARDQGWSPAQTIIVPNDKIQAYYREGPDLTRENMKSRVRGIVLVFRQGNFHVLIILKTSK